MSVAYRTLQSRAYKTRYFPVKALFRVRARFTAIHDGRLSNASGEGKNLNRTACLPMWPRTDTEIRLLVNITFGPPVGPVYILSDCFYGKTAKRPSNSIHASSKSVANPKTYGLSTFVLNSKRSSFDWPTKIVHYTRILSPNRKTSVFFFLTTLQHFVDLRGKLHAKYLTNGEKTTRHRLGLWACFEHPGRDVDGAVFIHVCDTRKYDGIRY